MLDSSFLVCSMLDSSFLVCSRLNLSKLVLSCLILSSGSLAGYSSSSIPNNCSISFNKLENPLKVGELFSHNTTSGQSTSSVLINELDYPDIPKCNIVEMAAKEVNLTRKTVLAIFKGLNKEKINEFMANPNGFTGQFIAVLKELVANHIACNIEYTKSDGQINKDVDALFPVEEVHSTTELVNAKKDRAIYEKVQVDSEVERHFVDVLNNKKRRFAYYYHYYKKYNTKKII